MLIFIFFFSLFNVRAGILLSEKQIIDKYKKNIVLIKVFSQSGNVETGTGFVIKNNNVVFTNSHLLENFNKTQDSKIQVMDHLGKIYTELEISQCNLSQKDICLLKIKGYKSDLGLSEQIIGEGQRVYSIANGICHEKFKLLDGILSRKKTTQEIIEYALDSSFKEKYSVKTEIFLTSIDLCQGDSGSPVFAQSGDLLGMNTLVVIPRDKNKPKLNIGISVNELITYLNLVNGQFFPIPKSKIITDIFKPQKEL